MRGCSRREAVGFVLLLGSCGPSRVHPPAAPPMLVRPSDAIPADLDAALRIDLVQARQALGAQLDKALDLNTIDADEDPPGGRLVVDALAKTDTAWLAFRPGLPAALTDNVLILRGRFAGLDVRGYEGDNRWGPPADLGGDFRLFERKPPRQRSAPCRLYARSDDLLVFVSEAEVDSVERALEQGKRDERMDPPDRGTISLALRVQPLLSHLEPRLSAVADLLSAATRVTGHASVDGSGLHAELEVAFLEAEAARSATSAGSELLQRLAHAEGVIGMVARGSRLTTVGLSLVIGVDLRPEVLGEILAARAL